MNAPPNSPAAAQMNEAIKNVAAMNANKVGGKRKSRKARKSRGKTRKNIHARKSTRKSGGRRPNNYSDCAHIYNEKHVFPSLLLRVANRTNKGEPIIGPARPTKFYDCEEIYKNGETTNTYEGRSCDAPRFNGMIIHKDDIVSMGYANTVDEIVAWCCETSG